MHGRAKYEGRIERNTSGGDSGGIKYGTYLRGGAGLLTDNVYREIEDLILRFLQIPWWDLFGVLLVNVLLHNFLYFREDALGMDGSLKRQKAVNCLRA